MAKILIVEDQLETLNAVRTILQSERHVVDCADTSETAREYIKTYEYELLVLDWELPGMSGVEFLQLFRSAGGKCPVIMLTGRGSTPDKIQGLDSGADSYITKPFESEVLLSCVRAKLRRSVPSEPESLSFKNITFTPDLWEVRCNERKLVLSAKEGAVLKLLIEGAARIVSADELKRAGWSDNLEVSSAAMRVFLSSLREKLTGAGAEIQIANVRGYGYQIK